MKLAGFRPTTVTQVKDAPNEMRWLDLFMAPRDKQVADMTQLLQKFASILDNLNVDVQTVGFKHNIELEVSTTVKVGYHGVSVIHSEVDTQSLPRLTVRRVSNIVVALKMTWDTDPVGSKDVTFIVWGL